MISEPSLKRRDKWPKASPKPSSTMGRGGMVLASFLCSLALNASSTGFPRECVESILGKMDKASIQGSLAFAGSLTC